MLTNCLSVFDHFVGLAFKGLTYNLKLTKRWAAGNVLPCILLICVAILMTNSFEQYHFKLFLVPVYFILYLISSTYERRDTKILGELSIVNEIFSSFFNRWILRQVKNIGMQGLFTIKRIFLLFWGILVEKVRIVCSRWNSATRQNRIYRIWWWCSLSLFWTENTFFWQIWSKNIKIVCLRWNLVLKIPQKIC